MSHLTHRHADLTPGERLAVIVAAMLVILTAWGSAIVMFVAAAGVLLLFWFSDSVRHHRLVMLTAFLIGIIITFKTVS